MLSSKKTIEGRDIVSSGFDSIESGATGEEGLTGIGKLCRTDCAQEFMAETFFTGSYSIETIQTGLI